MTNFTKAYNQIQKLVINFKNGNSPIEKGEFVKEYYNFFDKFYFPNENLKNGQYWVEESKVLDFADNKYGDIFETDEVENNDLEKWELDELRELFPKISENEYHNIMAQYHLALIKF